jgi:hypothetical protein
MQSQEIQETDSQGIKKHPAGPQTLCSVRFRNPRAFQRPLLHLERFRPDRQAQKKRLTLSQTQKIPAWSDSRIELSAAYEFRQKSSVEIDQSGLAKAIWLEDDLGQSCDYTFWDDTGTTVVIPL